MSSWSSKLETKLSALADSASKESLQTLAKWMGFNRKHASALSNALAEAIQKAGPARKWLYLQLVHEVLLLNMDDPKKWDRLADLRTTLGETVLLPSVGALHGDERLGDLLNQWEEKGVLGSPTLLAQIQQAYSSPSTTNDVEPAVNEPSSKAETESVEESKPTETLQEEKEGEAPVTPSSTEVPKEEIKKEEQVVPDPEESKADTSEVVATPAPKDKPEQDSAERTATPTSPATIKFDFEKEDIPQGKVESREFLEPCRAIATLQIARDLRSDNAVQLSSLFSSIPESAMNICRFAKEEAEKTGEEAEISEKDMHELCKHFNDEVLELDLDESLQNIQTFSEIVEKQSAARKRLIYLLIRSRCHFGADEAAEAFYKLDETDELLKKRKELLLDAMALEGLDVEEDKPTSIKLNEQPLPPLTWYTGASSEPDAKRAKLE